MTRRPDQNDIGRAARASAGFIACLAGACVGSIGDGPPGTAEGRGAAPDPVARTPVPGATGGAPGAMGGGAPAGGSGAVAPAAISPGPMALRRLTNDEYDRTVTALLGAAPGASDRYRFREDPVDGEGYDNLLIGLGISEDRVFEYREAAQGLAAEVMASPTRRQQVVGCDVQAQGVACLTSFIRSFGRRAFRAPLEQAEVDRLVKLAQLAPAAAGPFGGAMLALEAMLQSSRFLFRVEIGAPDPQRPGWLRLSGHEVAARLAYLLWGTSPDDALLDAAATGLQTAEQVAARGRMMMADARAKEGLRRFVAAWLRHTTFDRRPNSDPAWTPSLLADAREETIRLVERHVWPQGADFFALLTTRSSELTAQLAKVYGVTAGAGGGWQPVTFGADSERRGLLTQASFLGLTGGGGAMLTPVLRGQFIREALLCQPVPPPPPDAVMAAMDLAMADSSQTLRQRWDATLAGKPACRACHDLMNPLGFGIERFDRIGRHVDRGARGEVLTAEGRLSAGGADELFVGSDGLAALLVDRPELAACVVRQLHRFAHGSPTGDGDSAVVQQLGDGLRRSRDFKALVAAFVSSDAYLYGLPQQ